MVFEQPLAISRSLVLATGTRTRLHYADRIPRQTALVVVSNHRSFLDAPLLMAALNRPIHFACHHYMSQVPGLREIVGALGCVPLAANDGHQRQFLRQTTRLLADRRAVGIFPEGAQPMVQYTAPHALNQFHRGFAHVALRVPVPEVAILPVAIAATDEFNSASVPLPLLRLFDPSEPLFEGMGWHPAIIYRQVNLLIGQPLWITAARRQHYRGRSASAFASELTATCRDQIADLLQWGCY